MSEKGICRKSVVPIRTAPSHDAAMVSQLLFGEHYEVIERVDEWLHIRLYFDHSQGWIHGHGHNMISEDYFNQINLSDYKVCTDISGTIFFQKKHVHILLGSILPITTNELFKMEEQIAFNGESKSLSARREFEFFKETVRKFNHAPYLKGGRTPFGVDDGGFLQQLYRINGYQVPRSIDQVKKAARPFDGSCDPGDIVILHSDQAFAILDDGYMAGMLDGEVQRVKIEEIKDRIALKRPVLQKTASADAA